MKYSVNGDNGDMCGTEPIIVDGVWCHEDCPFGSPIPATDEFIAGSHCDLIGEDLDYYDGFVARCSEEQKK